MDRRSRQGAVAVATVGFGVLVASWLSLLPAPLTSADTAVPLVFGLGAAVTCVWLVVARRRANR